MKILHAIHDFLPRHRAGAEIYVWRLAREQARSHGVSILCADYDLLSRHGSLRWRAYDGLPVVELINNWAFTSFTETYRARHIETTLAHVLRAIQPDVLHVHSLLTLSMALPRLARARGIPTVATLHDYSLVCPSGGQRVHVAAQHVCREIDPARCGRCFVESPLQAQIQFARLARLRGVSQLAGRLATTLRRRSPRVASRLGQLLRHAGPMSIPTSDIVSRLRVAREVFEDVDLFVAPSAALAEDFIRQGLPAAKLIVSDNGIPPLRVRRRPSPEGRLRIGFVGSIVWTKGVHVLLDAVRTLPRDAVEVKIFGNPDIDPGYVASLRARAAGLPVRFMGPFAGAGLEDCYAEIDVLVVPSLWPENSPLVIHEAFMTGVPVVASRIGGIPELVRDGENGLLYETGASASLAACMQRLLDERGLLRRLAASVPPVKSIEANAKEWDALYDRVLAGRAGGAVAR